MSELDKLLKINKKRRDRCVGFSYINEKCHFAISGIGNEGTWEYDLIEKSLLKILGEDSVNVGSDYAFNALPGQPGITVHMKNLERTFYKDLKSKGVAFLDYSWLHLGVEHLYSPYYLNERLFSCVEKKIIGYYLIKFPFNLDYPDIYVVMKPCFLCLPIVKKAYFISNKHILGFEEIYFKVNIKAAKILE